MTPEEHLAGSPLGLAVLGRLRDVLRAVPDVEVRASRSQVAFRRRRGFAWLWLPGLYLAHPDAEVVVSIALAREDDSPRWKQVAHPTAWHWIHHLEIGALEDVDEELAGWLLEAAARAG